MTTRFEVGQSWAVLTPIEQSIKEKIEAVGKPLKDWDVAINYGIKTGLNEAFVISGEKKDELILADPKSAEIIRPILRGKDIKRYQFNFADQWLIATFPSKKYNIDKYPAVKKYLLNFGKERLEQSGKTYIINGEQIKSRKKTNNKWFETQDSISYWEDFSKQKIIWAELARTGNAFTYDCNQNILLNTSYILVNKNNKISLKHILGNLNSKIILFYMNMISSKFDKNGWRWLKQFVEKLPILQNKNLNIDTIVNKILNSQKNERLNLEKELNYIIYDMYCLTENEKNFIDDYKFFETEI